MCLYFPIRPESGFIRIITRYEFNIMVLMKMIFSIALYFPIIFSWACRRDGNDDYLAKCSDYLGIYEVIWRSEIISFSCSTNIDKNTASIGSSIGATLHDDACCRALFMRLSNASMSSSLNALLNTKSSITISSSGIRKLGIVPPISTPKFIQSRLPEGH
jgi:hypothetical protein